MLITYFYYVRGQSFVHYCIKITCIISLFLHDFIRVLSDAEKRIILKITQVLIDSVKK